MIAPNTMYGTPTTTWTNNNRLNVIQYSQGSYTTSTWTSGYAMGSRTSDEVAVEQLGGLADQLRRHDGKNWRAVVAVIAATTRDFKKLAREMQATLDRYASAECARLYERRYRVLERRALQRPIVRSRTCSPSSSRTSVPPHARCPR